MMRLKSDFFTLVERWGSVRGKTVCYVGDGNNTCHSLIHTAAKIGRASCRERV